MPTFYDGAFHCRGFNHCGQSRFFHCAARKISDSYCAKMSRRLVRGAPLHRRASLKVHIDELKQAFTG